MTSSSPSRMALLLWLLLPILLGALCGGSMGGGYGAYLHIHPEYKEKLIQQRLSQPHPDNYHYLASAQAIRYMNFSEIVLRKAMLPAVIGGVVGAIAGAAVFGVRFRASVSADETVPSRRFSLVELLIVVSIVGILFALLMDVGAASGMVYYEGHHQFYWCEQLEFAKASERQPAIQAACHLLAGKPFVCRSRMITALGKCGEDADILVPLLERLSQDQEVGVRKAAIAALSQLTAAPNDRTRPEGESPR